MITLDRVVRDANKRLGWALRAGAALGGAWICAGCGAYSVAATDGRVFGTSETMRDPTPSALLASASHDLPCGSDQVDVTRLDPEREYKVSGCGASVLYRVLTPTPMSKRVELLSRSPALPASDHPASMASQATAVARGG